MDFSVGYLKESVSSTNFLEIFNCKDILVMNASYIIAIILFFFHLRNGLDDSIKLSFNDFRCC